MKGSGAWDFAMVKSGDGSIVVGSVAVSFDVFISPPPETVAVFVTEAGASLATLTDIVIGSKLCLPARASFRVQVTVPKLVLQDQGKPLARPKVNALGSVSVTVTVPLVAPRPMLLT